jgi:hypothetical protein
MIRRSPELGPVGTPGFNREPPAESRRAGGVDGPAARAGESWRGLFLAGGSEPCEDSEPSQGCRSWRPVPTSPALTGVSTCGTPSGGWFRRPRSVTGWSTMPWSASSSPSSRYVSSAIPTPTGSVKAPIVHWTVASNSPGGPGQKVQICCPNESLSGTSVLWREA